MAFGLLEWRRVVIVAVVAASPGLVWAIESGIGQTLPGAGSVSIRGYQGSSDVDVYEYDNRGGSESEISERFLELGYGLSDHLAVMGRWGQMEWDPKARSGGVYEYGSAWGVGVHFQAPAWENDLLSTTVEWGFAYNRGIPDKRLRSTGDIFEGEIEWWQTTLGAVGRWERIEAYAGFRYCQVDLVYTHDSSAGTRRGGYEEDTPINTFLGARIAIWQGLSAYAEMQTGSVRGTFFGISYDVPLSVLTGETR